VPIRFYASDEELARLFNSINGLIFPARLGRASLQRSSSRRRCLLPFFWGGGHFRSSAARSGAS